MRTVSRALAPFGTTIFTTMSRLALEHSAVNLAQGFPDFDGPDWAKEAFARALRDEHNQYAPMPGVPTLRRALADRWERHTGATIDADTQVCVTAGCTEAIAAAIFGLCDPGDEVILFEPFYDSYRACVAMAGCSAKVVSLVPGSHGRFTFDPAQLAAAFSPRTRAILVNTPHNPTGKVFTAAELEQVASLCRRHNALAITDEVYERLVYDPARLGHVRLATLPDMAERTVTLSSLGKTFSFTGWKIGWALGPAGLIAAVKAAHQFLTFAVSTPAQHAAAAALRREDEYVAELMSLYSANRATLSAALVRLGLRVFEPDGTYFIYADHSALGIGDDVAFCQKLIHEAKVAAIPPSVFYERAGLGQGMVRFAFCKRRETIAEAVRRLEEWSGRPRS